MRIYLQRNLVLKHVFFSNPRFMALNKQELCLTRPCIGRFVMYVMSWVYLMNDKIQKSLPDVAAECNREYLIWIRRQTPSQCYVLLQCVALRALCYQDNDPINVLEENSCTNMRKLILPVVKRRFSYYLDTKFVYVL